MVRKCSHRLINPFYVPNGWASIGINWKCSLCSAPVETYKCPCGHIFQISANSGAAIAWMLGSLLFVMKNTTTRKLQLILCRFLYALGPKYCQIGAFYISPWNQIFSHCLVSQLLTLVMNKIWLLLLICAVTLVQLTLHLADTFCF